MLDGHGRSAAATVTGRIASGGVDAGEFSHLRFERCADCVGNAERDYTTVAPHRSTLSCGIGFRVTPTKNTQE